MNARSTLVDTSFTRIRRPTSSPGTRATSLPSTRGAKIRTHGSLTERAGNDRIELLADMRFKKQGRLGLPYASLDLPRGILLRGAVLCQFF